MGKTIYDIKQITLKYFKLLEKSLLNGRTVVTNDFKSILTGFSFDGFGFSSLPREQLDIYDVFLPVPQVPSTYDEAVAVVHGQLDRLEKTRLKIWQKVAANASVVYESLERQGVLVGGLHRYSKWTHRTVSGRSKNTGFNLQGTTAKDDITDPNGSQSDLFLNFDWRAADIRVAALLSGDDHLNEMSLGSDPYQTIADIVDQPRKDCKIMLLRAINSIDIEHPIIQMFPELKKWMVAQKEKLENSQPVKSILGREFFNAEKPRSAFNSTMQGSIAQAMQLTIRRVWEDHYRLLAETHDSITIACNADRNVFKETVRAVANIMCKPFAGILESNPTFPVRVNVGKSWCQWKPFGLYLDVDKFQSCRCI
jgi:hypothetical protein